MSDPKKRQFNLRLNDVAEKQLDELAEHYNVPKAAIIKMAVSHMYKKYFPDAPDIDDDDESEAPAASTGTK